MKIIAAVSLNGVIGNQGKVPFKIKEDLKRFKQLTENNIVIMGANTFFNDLESKALPNRTNIVISSKVQSFNYKYPFSSNDKYYMVGSPVNAVELAYDLIKCSDKTIWIIGGSKIYSRFLSPYDFEKGNPVNHLVTEMYITHVHSVYDGDAYFQIDWAKWKVEEEEHHDGYSFVKYLKI